MGVSDLCSRGIINVRGVDLYIRRITIFRAGDLCKRNNSCGSRRLCQRNTIAREGDFL